jgi:nitroimidazol reductase NimA-like FMN-containing flavoprotein (pyridoxamine 5'-phosphate oxidase superfamily)
MSFLSTAVQQVLEQGSFCAVASTTPRGPHCTPLVFAYSGGRVWITTSRRSVKARAWKVDPVVAGLVRSGELSVTFTGTVRTYDVLDRSTWAAALSGATSIARAGTGFSKKNAKFFAGYAVDARQVPFAWMPPGRVFVGVDVERTALLGEDGVQEGRGRWGGESLSNGTFRSTKSGGDPLSLLPADVGEALGIDGDAALTISGARGPVVLPTRWRVDGGALYAALPAETLALAGVGPEAPVALTMDRASEWRARDMVGAMVQGTGAIFVLDGLGSGAKTARKLAVSIDPEAGALVRIKPVRIVWWKGWTSGSLAVDSVTVG